MPNQVPFDAARPRPGLLANPVFKQPAKRMVLYFQVRRRRFTRFMDFDMNWWGVLAFPIGTLICFGPVLVAWALTYRTGSSPQDRKNRR